MAAIKTRLVGRIRGEACGLPPAPPAPASNSVVRISDCSTAMNASRSTGELVQCSSRIADADQIFALSIGPKLLAAGVPVEEGDHLLEVAEAPIIWRRRVTMCSRGLVG
jgi:hypothetical protein